MAKFRIIQANPELYQKEIIGFWQAYLPGTPPQRLQWLQTNPAGPAIWFLAFEEESNKLAGTLTVTPRNMYMQGSIIQVGIMGDFMTASQYRIFGPAMALQRMAVKLIKDNNYKFIYTLPNDASIKIAQRVGFDKTVKLHYLVKPISVSHYLNKYLNNIAVKFVEPVFKIILNLLSKDTYMLGKGFYDESSKIDESFDVLWKTVKCNYNGLIGVHDSQYLSWKYVHNPSHKYKVVTYRDEEFGPCLGYMIFTISDKKIEVFDILTVNNKVVERLIKRIIRIAKKMHCQALYIRLSETNSLLKIINQFGFFDARNEAGILTCGVDDKLYSKWQFFEGDRNT